MRVIAGLYKNRLLHSPKGMGTRPVMDRVKAYIFDVLGSRVEGARACDLFAGSGAVGIEALSRGAAGVDFVEMSIDALKTIRRNLELLAITGDHIRVIRSDVMRFIGKPREPYDLVFCDPPYRFPRTAEVVCRMLSGGILAPGGMLVVEHAEDGAWRSGTESLESWRRKTFGRTVISMFQ